MLKYHVLLHDFVSQVTKKHKSLYLSDKASRRLRRRRVCVNSVQHPFSRRLFTGSCYHPGLLMGASECWRRSGNPNALTLPNHHWQTELTLTHTHTRAVWSRININKQRKYSWLQFVKWKKPYDFDLMPNITSVSSTINVPHGLVFIKSNTWILF